MYVKNLSVGIPDLSKTAQKLIALVKKRMENCAIKMSVLKNKEPEDTGFCAECEMFL